MRRGSRNLGIRPRETPIANRNARTLPPHACIDHAHNLYFIAAHRRAQETRQGQGAQIVRLGQALARRDRCSTL